eukprot:CAMPEP_0197027608 /NCGR_PEP_ID=MMETSP1384-20130603/7484_1 /TAXON_ID=29189 /ORGANISM="Ammonia sp." /LENGTH=361 /DNA_ID=CAMNT_0042456475 /DNA_START=52 /DNA_END=1137 /DNA_ORIENTATION=-
MEALDTSHDDIRSLKRKEVPSDEILSEIKRNIRRRCIKQSRKYTFRDLYMVRQLQSYRELPANLLCNPEGIISAGQGLCINMQHGLESQFHQRLKQIKLAKNSIGYKNYTSLVPKTERSANLPRTPSAYDIERHSKRTFDNIVSKWKKRLHEWDNIASHAEIPYHLLTPKLLHQRQVMSSRRPRSSQRYLWSPKNRARSPWRQKVQDDGDHDDEKAAALSEIQNDYENMSTFTREQMHGDDAGRQHEAGDEDDTHCKLRLEFDEDDERDDDDKKSSPRYEEEDAPVAARKKAMAPAGKSSEHNRDNVIGKDSMKISTNEAVKCLQDCISSVTSGNQANSGNDYGELIVKKFSEKLTEITQK